MLWSNLIDVFRGGLFVLAHWCGGSLGAAILLASLGARIALLPVTLGATRRRLVLERKMRELAPELEAIKRGYRSQPQLMLEKTRELQRANGVAMLDGRSFFTSLVQFPPGAALYSAIRGSAANAGGFLWIRDLARPDRMLAVSAGLIAGAAAWFAAANPAAKGAAQITPALIAAAITLLFLSHLSAGLALYSITNSVVGVAERALAQRSLESGVA
jgi:YidC/Oxa1 family membrane protein insertase